MSNYAQMLVGIDAICQRYNVLPSVFLRSGDMIDFYIAQAGADYQIDAEKMRKEGIDPSKGYYHGKTQEELLAMMERADAISRQKQNKSKTQ